MAQQRLSIALPLSLGDADGPYFTHNDMEAVATQNLKMIVLTSPGERVMDSNFGVGIRSYLFEQATPFLEKQIKERVSSQVTTYLPFVKLLKIDIRMDPDNGFLALKINYMVPGSSKVSEMTIPVTA
jgi:hypothetical protein